MATNRLTPGREGYKILFNDNMVIMNYKFAAAAAKYGTKENKLMKDIRTDFPGMAEVVVSGRERPSAKSNSRLTYANMEKHIRAYDNADELLDVFETVKALSAPLAGCRSAAVRTVAVQEPGSLPVRQDCLTSCRGAGGCPR